jgi:hypothetical protein
MESDTFGFVVPVKLRVEQNLLNNTVQRMNLLPSLLDLLIPSYQAPGTLSKERRRSLFSIRFDLHSRLRTWKSWSLHWIVFMYVLFNALDSVYFKYDS